MDLTKITEEEYRKHPALSQSKLVQFSKSAAHYRYGETETTKAMALGTVLHRAKLEGKELASFLSVEPAKIPNASGIMEETNRRIQKHRDYLLNFRKHEESQGKTVLTQNEYDNLIGMLTSLAVHPRCQEIFSHTTSTELPAFWDWEGLQCKGMADIVGIDSDGRKFVVDLKKTQSAHKSKIGWTIQKYNYDVQAYFYMQGFKPDYFLFIFVEEKPYGKDRHAISVVRASEALLHAGEIKAKTWADQLKYCQANDIWPSYNNDEIEDISPPDYAMKKLEENEFV